MITGDILVKAYTVDDLIAFRTYERGYGGHGRFLVSARLLELVLIDTEQKLYHDSDCGNIVQFYHQGDLIKFSFFWLTYHSDRQISGVKQNLAIHADGESLNAIATYLNENGIRTPSNREGAIWKSGSIKRILTNEKYKGDARLQKTYVEDFLTKKVKINRGERKQWYIQDSHDAIVSPETFELAQKELARRSGRHGRFYDSPFTGKIICGDCGGLYGHRVWHSNEACRKEVWLCNGKYENGSVCQTPAITESAIIQAFLIAANRIQKRTEYCDEYEANILPLIGDTSRLDADRERLNDEKNEAIDMLEKLIDDSSKHAQEQEVFEEKRGTLELQIETKRALIETIDQQIADIRSRKENALIFIQGVRRLGNNYMIKEFDISTWHAFVDYATVMPDKSIVFHFRNGDEEVVQLEKAQ